MFFSSSWCCSISSARKKTPVFFEGELINFYLLMWFLDVNSIKNELLARSKAKIRISTFSERVLLFTSSEPKKIMSDFYVMLSAKMLHHFYCIFSASAANVFGRVDIK